MFFFFFTDCRSSVPGSCALCRLLLVVTPGCLFLLCTWAPHCHDKHPCLAKSEGHAGLCLPRNTRASASLVLALPSWFPPPSPPRPPRKLTSGGLPGLPSPLRPPMLPVNPGGGSRWASQRLLSAQHTPLQLRQHSLAPVCAPCWGPSPGSSLVQLGTRSGSKKLW